MKPSELFPGAVVLDQDSNPIVIEPHNLYVMMDCVTPLPISPAVLRGLGLKKKRLCYVGRVQVDHMGGPHWFLENKNKVTSVHEIQALSLHLYGVELTWNQDEYEKAMKEETK